MNLIKDKTMAILDLTYLNRLQASEGSANEKIRQFGNIADFANEYIQQFVISLTQTISRKSFNTLELISTPIWDTIEKTNAGYITIYEYLKQNKSFDDFKDFLYEYKLHSSPLNVKTMDAEYTFLGEGQPKFNFDID
jgi:hypothetical protein